MPIPLFYFSARILQKFGIEDNSMRRKGVTAQLYDRTIWKANVIHPENFNKNLSALIKPGVNILLFDHAIARANKI